jgi:hypothetical protein
MSTLPPGTARLPAAWSSLDDLFANKYLSHFFTQASTNTTCKGISQSAIKLFLNIKSYF